MASHIQDRWLWLGLGIFTFLAVKGVSHSLHHLVSLTQVHNAPPSPPPTRTEDAIKTSSLRTLATCPNVEIRKAATKLLLDRFIAHPSAYKHLIRDVNSRDSQRRHAARLAFGLLEKYGYVHGPYGVPPTPRRAWRQDVEERELRRRRREAMVINEGDRPVSQEDVWMRDGEGRMGTEEQMRRRAAWGMWQAGTSSVDPGTVETGEDAALRVVGEAAS